MLHKISVKLAKKLSNDLSEEKETVYIYGVEIILSTMLGINSILFLSWLLNEFQSGVIFLTLFAPLRVFTGGYHAKTYSGCFIISNISYLLILSFNNIISSVMPIKYWIGLLVIACGYILLNAPILNAAQPISMSKSIRCRRMTRNILVLDIIGILYLAINHRNMVSMAILSICLVAAFMLITDKSMTMQFVKKGVMKV